MNFAKEVSQKMHLAGFVLSKCVPDGQDLQVNSPGPLQLKQEESQFTQELLPSRYRSDGQVKHALGPDPEQVSQVESQS